MTTIKDYAHYAAPLLACLALTACGGGGSGSSSNSAPGTATVAFANSTMSVAQSAGTASVQVARAGDSAATTTVNYQTQDGTALAGTNYTAANGSVSWAAGDTAAKPISVTLSSAAFSGDKSFTISLMDASGATLGAPASATVTINGSGAAATPGTVAVSASSASVAQSAGSVMITVNRSGGSSGAASVAYATADGSATAGSNYTSASGTLQWASGDAAAKSFAVTLSSAAFSGSKTFSVKLSSATGATLGTPATDTVTITGSGAVATSGTLALSASSASVAESAGSVLITVNRSGGSLGAASVAYATADGSATAGSNYTSASGTLQWAAADAASKSFSVTLATTAFSGSKAFTVKLSNATGAALGTPATDTVTITGSGAGTGGTGPAAALAAKLGAPSRLLVGLGQQSEVDTISAVQTQGLKVDIYERYLGGGDWTTWNAPPCDYVCMVAAAAQSIGAIPMFTYYQMANNGDGNYGVMNDATFMSTYWAHLKLMFQDLATYGKPALVNLEPDFWGYTEQNAPNGDPTQLPAMVSSNPDCSTLANNAQGLAQCMIAMARKYAPKAAVGFPFSTWGGSSDSAVIAYMNALGAQNADFIVEQTLDRDAGCFEVSPQPAWCIRSGTFYWDESNQTHPNFQDHLTAAQAYHSGIGNLPLIWWQTPMGVPSSSAGGSVNNYRDDRVHYFLTHPTQLTAVGGLGVVFGTGEDHQTNITTDGGQMQTLNGQYFANPAPLP